MCSYEVRHYARNKWDSEDLCPDVDKLFKDKMVVYHRLCGYVLKTCTSDRTEYMYTKELIFVNIKQDYSGITQITSRYELKMCSDPGLSHLKTPVILYSSNHNQRID